jgi:CRISPR-associated protein Csm2
MNQQTHRGFQPRHDARSDTPSITVEDIRFGEISEDLYAGIAEKKAETIAGSGKREQNKSTQLRRFYDELVLWNEKINGKGTTGEREARYKELAPLIKMLNAKVVYAEGRGHVDANFVALFRRVIAEIRNPRTLDQAKLFMEAFMGFYKAHKG